MTTPLRRTGRALELLAAVGLPLLGLGFVAGDRGGLWDRILGLHHVEAVAARLETSYAHGVDRKIGPDEEAWRPLVALIRKYSPAKLPPDREPTFMARGVAVISGRLQSADDVVAEWTAPSTPLYFYFGAPSEAGPFPAEDVLQVGTLGDLRSWMQRRRDGLRFVFQDFFLAAAGVALGFLLWTASGRS